MRAAFANAIDRANEALSARRFRVAAALLSRAPACSNVERRMRAHLLGLARIRLGETASAFRLWDEAERRFGKHALLTSDFIEELRARGSYASSGDRARSLELELAKANSLLSPETAARACLTLSRTAEDDGAVSSARGYAARAAALAGVCSPLRRRAEARLLWLDSRHSSDALPRLNDDAPKSALDCAESTAAWAVAFAAAGDRQNAFAMAEALASHKEASVEWRRRAWLDVQCDFAHFGIQSAAGDMPECLGAGGEAASAFWERLTDLEARVSSEDERLCVSQKLCLWILQSRTPGDVGANARACLDRTLSALTPADAAAWAVRMKSRFIARTTSEARRSAVPRPPSRSRNHSLE